MFSYVCTACGKKTPADTLAPVCGCGGLFELDFKSPKWDDAKIDQKCWSIFRYRDFMAVDGDVWQSVSLGEGMTPLVELEPGLYVKVDYAMPTLSFNTAKSRCGLSNRTLGRKNPRSWAERR